MMCFIKTIMLLLVSFLMSAQNTKISILDVLDKTPLNGIQILSENGSFIGNSNSKGEFEFDKSIFQQSDVKSFMIYDSNYLPIEYKIDEIPAIVYLEKIKSYQLDEVTVVKKLSEKYFTIKGYARSWQLVNNKLVKYADALIEYHIPYENSNNEFNTGIKNFVSEYRTFKIDSIKQKSRIVSISIFDSFINYFIPKRDLLERGWKKYETKLIKDSLFAVYEKGRNIGYYINNKNNNATEISVSESFEGDEAIKMLFWKFSGSYKIFEKWTGNGETRRPSYLFSNEKTLVETKIKGKYNAIETINEIFIGDKIIYNDKKPIIYKSNIDKDRSFYNSEFWKEQIKKHPLPSAITEQLINVNENKNNY